MTQQRYEIIREEWWPWLDPAVRGLDADLKALEQSSGQSGSLPANFYTGDEAP